MSKAPGFAGWIGERVFPFRHFWQPFFFFFRCLVWLVMGWDMIPYDRSEV